MNSDQVVPAEMLCELSKSQLKAQAASQERVRRISEIRSSLEFIHPGSNPLFEIRILGIRGSGKPRQASGYFDDVGKAAVAVFDYDAKVKPAGIYVTLNQPRRALLSRAPNVIVQYPEKTTADSEIERRRWLLIDCDPHRESGIAATAEERGTARELCFKVKSFLEGQNWPPSMVGDTGNGYSLLYRIDLPVDEESNSLVKAVLVALDEKFSWHEPGVPWALIDTSVFNASRIGRLYGTFNRKGFSTTDRPHRQSRIVERPDEIVEVKPDQLRAIAALAPKAVSSNNAATSRSLGNQGNSGPRVTFPRLDIARWLADRQIQYTTKPARDGRTVYILPECPFDSSHGKNGEVCIMQAADGKMSAKCMHNSCARCGWQQFKAAIGAPGADHYDPPLQAGRGNTSGQQNHDASVISIKPSSAGLPQTRIIEVIPSAEFATTDYQQRYLVKGILVADQPAICGGKSKSMKTTMLLDLAISLGTGTPFLGTFEAAKARVAVLSGESGHFTIQETARRICAARAVNLEDAAVFWGFDLPQLARPSDLGAVADMILAHDIEVVIIDPAYLCLLGGDVQHKQASNIFDMGPLLLGLTEVGNQTNSTIILCHHCRKNSDEKWSPPDLEDLAMAGFAEWARQWILLGRREPYQQGTGKHQLWLNIGGSAGHSGCWALDVDEGRLADDFTGRKWDVEVGDAAKAKFEKELQIEARKARQQEEKNSKARAKVLKALKIFPDGETARIVRESAHINNNQFRDAIEVLLEEGLVESCTVIKNGKEHVAYKLKAELDKRE